MRRGIPLPLVAAVAGLPLIAVVLTTAAIEIMKNAEPAVSKEWSWSRGPDSPIERTDGTAARVGRSIYVVGGFVEGGLSSSQIERYEIDKRRWSEVEPLPVPVDHAAAIGHGGFLYVLGGYSHSTGAEAILRNLYRYDPRRNRWARLPSAPTARAAMALGAMRGRLYAAGGANERGALTTLEVYDIRRRRWTTGRPFSVPREHLGGAALGGSFYAVGGRNEAGNLKIVERYTPGKGWKRVADLGKARGGNGAAAWVGGRRVFAVGGEEPAGTIREVEEFDGRRWRRLPHLPTARHGLGVVFDERGKRLYAIEGGTSPGLTFSNRLEILRRN
jgi:N-acetylneuraminic acid mutarotase